MSTFDTNSFILVASLGTSVVWAWAAFRWRGIAKIWRARAEQHEQLARFWETKYQESAAQAQDRLTISKHARSLADHAEELIREAQATLGIDDQAPKKEKPKFH